MFRRGTLLLTAALVLALAGCGGDDAEEGAGDAGATETANGATGEDAASIVVEMSPQQGSEQNGSATLTEIDEGTTQVVVELFDGPDNPQPAHIHSGTCDELGGVEYPLNDLEEGRSQTQVDVSLEELRSGEFAINAHRSADEIDQYTACGEIAQGD